MKYQLQLNFNEDLEQVVEDFEVEFDGSTVEDEVIRISCDSELCEKITIDPDTYLVCFYQVEELDELSMALSDLGYDGEELEPWPS